MLLPSDNDDMFDDMISSDEEEDDISDDDFDEPSFGSEEDDYSAGCLSTIWEEETHENDNVANSEVDISNRSALQTLHTSQNCGDDSFLNDSANRDLWKSNSSFTQGEAPLYSTSGDDFNLDTLDSSFKKESKPLRRWSSEMSYGSISTFDSGLVNDDRDETPRVSHRKSLGARSQSDTSLNSNNNTSNTLDENRASPIPAAAPEQSSEDSIPQKKSKSLMETGDAPSDALLAQMVAAYLNDGGEANFATMTRQKPQQSNFKSRLSLDSFLAASQPRSGRRNQPPGKPRRTSSPIRRRSADSMSSAGESGVSVDSLMERLNTKPNANAFNADENLGKNDTPPVLTRPRQDVRRRPPGMPVRQRSLISIGVEEDSDEEDNEDSIHDDDVSDDESSAGASGPSSFRNGLVKRSSFMSSSSADMTIEEGDEEDISSDDETLESDAAESVPHIAPRQYLAPLKGGGDTDSMADSDLEEEEESVPSRHYLAPLKGDAAEDSSLRDYVIPSGGYLEEEEREYMLPMKGEEPSSPVVKEDSYLIEDSTLDDDGETESPTAQKELNHSLPEITTIKLPPEDERVDAKLVLEKYLLEEKGSKSPGTMARRRGSGQKRKIKYDMARSAISPKIDHLLSPAGKMASFKSSSVEKPNMHSSNLSIDLMDDMEGLPSQGPTPPQPSTQSQHIEEPENATLDLLLSPLQKKKTAVNRRNSNDKRIRIRSKMQQVETRLTRIRNILGEQELPEDQDIDYEQSSSTQLTEATANSAYFTDGSSEIEMDLPIQMGSTHSNHSTRSRSRHMTMAGIVDEAGRVPGPPIRSPRSPISPLQHPTPCEPTIMEVDGDAGSVSPHSGRKARTAIKIGFKKSKKRLQSLFRPSATDSSTQPEVPTSLSVQ